MENTVPVIDIGKAIVKKHENGHLCIFIKDEEDLEVEDVKQLIRIKDQFYGQEPHTALIIAGYNSGITSEARKYGSSKEAYDGAIAKSIVTKSLSSSLIGNFFIRFNKPPAPTRLFACEKEAIKWLDQMRDKAKKLL